MKLGGVGTELPASISIGEELGALRQAQAEILKRVENSVDSIAIELERIGEGQRFLTKVLSATPHNVESVSRSPQHEALPTRRPSSNAEL